ncbi:MAG: hypothetical protein LBL23_08045, partial [Coriobacteriales bacterium]|nr:hypothetical protein [Coriobacteriales bacterium]
FDCQRITDSPTGTYGATTTSAAVTVPADTIIIPTITIDAYGELSFSTANITANSTNDGIKITNGAIAIDYDTSKGLTMVNNQLAVYINNGGSGGLKFDNAESDFGKLQINAPTCAGNTQVLTWNGTAFGCTSGTDWNIAAEDTAGSANIADNSTVTFYGDDSLNVTRNGNDIHYSLNNTGVSAGEYNSTGTATTGDYKFNIPTFEVDAQGQLIAASTTALALTGGNGISMTSDGQIAIGLDANSGLSTSANGLKISAGNCTTGGLTFNNGIWGCFNINNGTLTLQRNGEKLGEFTANQSDPTTINFIDNNTTYTAGNGLTLTGGSFSINLRSGSGLRVDGNGLGLASCTTSGQVLKWNGSGWDCAKDNDTFNEDASIVCGTITSSTMSFGPNWGPSDGYDETKIYVHGKFAFANIIAKWNGPGDAPDRSLMMTIKDTRCQPKPIQGQDHLEYETRYGTVLVYYYTGEIRLRAPACNGGIAGACDNFWKTSPGDVSRTTMMWPSSSY